MEETLYFSGENYFKALVEAIYRARKSILLETYIFSYDVIGKEVGYALLKAASRGVKVQVLVDGMGSSNYVTQIVSMLSSLCEINVFHPLPWKLRNFIDHYPYRFLKSLLKINVRNHRKICIIDQNILFTGSFNITEDHINSPGHKGWRDTGLCIKNNDLSEVQKAFQVAWKNTNYPERIRNFFRSVKKNLTLRINNTWYRRRILHRDLLQRIRNAKQRIWITNAYFIPDSKLLKQLASAALRGIDVKILLPSHSDIAFMPWTSQTFYHHLLSAKVKIYEYLPSILHAKTLIIDDWMTVGSSNLNHRSLLHDLELDVVVQTASSKNLLATQFIKDLQNSKLININELTKRSWYKKLIGYFLLRLRYLM